MMFWLIALAFLAAFPLFWSAVVTLISKMGWSRLARAYRTEEEARGETFHSVSGFVGFPSYNGVLKVSIEPEGLRLAVMVLYRSGHPPVLIPWRDILNVRKGNVLIGSYYAFETDQAPGVTIRLPEHIIEGILELAD